jgi:hypothetical protein
MTTFEFPDEDLVDVTLRPAQRTVLGGGDLVPDQPKRIALGKPIGRVFDPATADEDTKSFLAGRSGSTFTLLKVTVGFVHEDEEPIESAWVDLRFDGEVQRAEPVVTVWAMKPLSESDPITVTTKTTVDASLKLTGPFSISIGTEANREKDVTYTQAAVKVEAVGEGTAMPRWRFSPTVTSPIRGTHRLLAVVETPTGVSATADISVGATLRLRKLKVFRYEAALQDLPDVAHYLVPPAA